MRKEVINTIYESISKGVNIGIGQLYTEDEFYDKTTITFGNKKHVNFGSYSYLGLELDPRLKAAAIDSIERYGIQYPSSRTYVSSTPYRELESLMGEIFGYPVILATTTTLAHVAVMPIVVGEGDVIIMDQQVHSSVQFMISNLQLQGIPFHIVRHNNMEQLEEKIIELSEDHKRVWYMIDGVYSMYGDTAPMVELEALLNKHKKFNLYVDDAHGMSWSGKNGAGFALSQIALHERMVLVTSLNKAFAAGGAVVVIPDPEVREKARTCGGPFIFAGQLQMSALGSGIACAKIHLSEEITRLQDDLKAKMEYCENELKRHNLPFIMKENLTPIYFVGVGLPRLGYKLVKKMITSGQYVNLAIFPAVSATCTGIRFTLTSDLSFEQIHTMVNHLAVNFAETLIEEKRSIEDIYKAFRHAPIYKSEEQPILVPEVQQHETKYHIQYESTIEAIPEELWNELFVGLGTFDWKGLSEIEKLYSNNRELHDNWSFHYYIIRDRNDKPVLATYFTGALLKDDSIAPEFVSQELELQRLDDPYYLCSKTFLMGSQLSIGSHLYLDRTRNDWKEIFMLFTDTIWREQEKLGMNSLNLRDFSKEDEELKLFLEEQGFMAADLPTQHSIQNFTPFKEPSEYLSQLKSDRKYFVRKRAIEKADAFNVNFLDGHDIDQLDRIYELYKNVKNKSFELNVFDTPKSLFELALSNDQWEVMTISLKDEPNPIALALNYKSADRYVFLHAGLDYDYVDSYDTYSQLLWQLLLRANDLGYQTVELGLTTAQNKRKFGATSTTKCAYIQMKDTYNFKVVSSMRNGDTMPRRAKKMNQDRRKKLEKHFNLVAKE